MILFTYKKHYKNMDMRVNVGTKRARVTRGTAKGSTTAAMITINKDKILIITLRRY
jgi:hypothetical protein